MYNAANRKFLRGWYMNKGFLVVLLLLLSLGGSAFGQSQADSTRAQAYFHFSQARLLDDQGQWEKAVEEYKQALALDPNNSLILSEMAETYLRHRMVREAVDAAVKAVQANRNNLEAHRLLSTIYINMLGTTNAQQPAPAEIIDKAVQEFEEIVRIDPAERQAYLMLGRLYQVRNQPARAADVYKTFLGLEPGSEEGVTSLAKLHIDAGNNQEAATLLEEFLKEAPESQAALETLGQAYSNSEQFEKAAAVYKRATELDADDLDLKKEYALSLFRARKFDDAARLYQEILSLEPDEGVALVRLGQIYREQRKYAPARQNLDKAVQLFPDSMEVQFSLVLLDRDEGLLNEAAMRTADLLRKTERANGRYSEAEKQNRRVFATNLGLFHSSLGRYDEAIRAFTEVKAMSSERDANVEAMIIDSYRSAKNIDKALEYCQSALKELPDSRELQLLHASLIAEKGRVEEGVQSIQKLFTGNSQDLDDVIPTVVDIYQKAKKFDQAHTVLDGAIRRFPSEEKAYFLQGSVFEKQKKFNEAERAFRKALEFDKDNAAVLNYLGFMLADRGTKLEEALLMIRKAVDSDPTNGAYLDSLGWVYFRLNRLDLAEEYLKLAVRFHGTDPDLHDHLGDLYFRMNRFEDARVEWNKAIELGDDPVDMDNIRKKLDGLRNRVANNK
jgi:tetratricopeptide (TPR) repeat protein